jgi:hypothetical protein
MFNPPDEVHTGLDLIRGYWWSYGKSKFNEPKIREEDSKIVSFFFTLSFEIKSICDLFSQVVRCKHKKCDKEYNVNSLLKVAIPTSRENYFKNLHSNCKGDEFSNIF